MAPAAQADELTTGCALSLDTPSGFLSIDPQQGSDGTLSMELAFETDADIVGADGRTTRFKLWGLSPIPATREAIPRALDNLVVTLQFGDARQIKAPTLIYYTRDNTIPLDIAPAKLWYPQYHVGDDRLEIAVTWGDLERDMEFGSGEKRASVLSWYAKQIGTGPLDEEIVAMGQLPLAPLREAHSALGAALEQVVAAKASGAC